MIHTNFQDAFDAVFKDTEDKKLLKQILDQELKIKSEGKGYSQIVINSCEARLKEMSDG